jgi:hypothetical protein
MRSAPPSSLHLTLSLSDPSAVLIERVSLQSYFSLRQEIYSLPRGRGLSHRLWHSLGRP